MFALQKTLQTPATLVDTGRKLNVPKTFRRRPGSLLSVLRPYNLRLCLRGQAAEVHLGLCETSMVELFR